MSPPSSADLTGPSDSAAANGARSGAAPNSLPRRGCGSIRPPDRSSGCGGGCTTPGDTMA